MDLIELVRRRCIYCCVIINTDLFIFFVYFHLLLLSLSFPFLSRRRPLSACHPVSFAESRQLRFGVARCVSWLHVLAQARCLQVCCMRIWSFRIQCCILVSLSLCLLVSVLSLSFFVSLLDTYAHSGMHTSVAATQGAGSPTSISLFSFLLLSFFLLPLSSSFRWFPNFLFPTDGEKRVKQCRKQVAT